MQLLSVRTINLIRFLAMNAFTLPSLPSFFLSIPQPVRIANWLNSDFLLWHPVSLENALG